MRSSAVPGEQVAQSVRRALRDWLASQLPGTVAAYVPMDDEVSVTELFEDLPGWRWVLVRVEDDGAVTFRDRAVPLEKHRFGMYQPRGTGAVVAPWEIDIFLVPGLAFSAEGARLGRGGGFYDRILADRRADSLAVGVTWSDRIRTDIPMADHDQPVDLLVTESGVIQPRSNP